MCLQPNVYRPEERGDCEANLEFLCSGVSPQLRRKGWWDLNETAALTGSRRETISTTASANCFNFLKLAPGHSGRFHTFFSSSSSFYRRSAEASGVAVCK